MLEERVTTHFPKQGCFVVHVGFAIIQVARKRLTKTSSRNWM